MTNPRIGKSADPGNTVSASPYCLSSNYPVRESLGRIWSTIPEIPGHCGLRETLKAEGKSADVEWVSARFDETWKDADVQLHMADLE